MFLALDVRLKFKYRIFGFHSIAMRVPKYKYDTHFGKCLYPHLFKKYLALYVKNSVIVVFTIQWRS